MSKEKLFQKRRDYYNSEYRNNIGVSPPSPVDFGTTEDEFLMWCLSEKGGGTQDIDDIKHNFADDIFSEKFIYPSVKSTGEYVVTWVRVKVLNTYYLRLFVSRNLFSLIRTVYTFMVLPEIGLDSEQFDVIVKDDNQVDEVERNKRFFRKRGYDLL